jgi:hypothetical protein
MRKQKNERISYPFSNISQKQPKFETSVGVYMVDLVELMRSGTLIKLGVGLGRASCTGKVHGARPGELGEAAIVIRDQRWSLHGRFSRADAVAQVS